MIDSDVSISDNDNFLMVFGSINVFSISSQINEFIFFILNGLLFFEINQYLGKETIDLLQKMNFATTELRKDIYGNDRMTKASVK